MAAQTFQLTLAAAAKRLSDVYGGAAGADPNAALDIPYRQVLLSASGADAFIGGRNMGALTTSTNYGTLVEDVATGGVEATSIGPFETGPVKLSDLWAAGASSVLHITAIPF